MSEQTTVIPEGTVIFNKPKVTIRPINVLRNTIERPGMHYVVFREGELGRHAMVWEKDGRLWMVTQDWPEPRAVSDVVYEVAANMSDVMSDAGPSGAFAYLAARVGWDMAIASISRPMTLISQPMSEAFDEAVKDHLQAVGGYVRAFFLLPCVDLNLRVLMFYSRKHADWSPPEHKMVEFFGLPKELHPAHLGGTSPWPKEIGANPNELGQVWRDPNGTLHVITPQLIEEVRGDWGAWSFHQPRPHLDGDYSYRCHVPWCPCMKEEEPCSEEPQKTDCQTADS